MNSDRSYEILLEIIQSRIPERKMLVARLMDVLHIEKEAVQRRLRGVVSFTFREIVLLAKEFNISLDNILILGDEYKRTRPCRLTMVNYLEPSEADTLMLEKYIENLERLKDDPDSEAATATNSIPQLFYVNYPFIYRFYIFKWRYQQGDPYRKIPYSEIYPSQYIKGVNQKYQERIKGAGCITIIWDHMLIELLVNDIKYFQAVHLISDEEVEMIKKDLYALLKELELLTLKGRFESGGKFEFYVSDINIETTQICINIGDDYRLTMIKWFTLADTAAADEMTFEDTRRWILSLKRSSSLISSSGEVQRIRFFERQQEIVDQL